MTTQQPSSISDFVSIDALTLPEDMLESAWTEHAPFAFYLVSALRPRVFVELGTHRGFSYFCFCQMAAQKELAMASYAIDTWMGDEHAGFYSEKIFRIVSRINEKYSSFSTLIRLRFDEAAAYFPDKYIDILHIDGRHGYDDVKEDFELWRPKLSANAIVLFHDTNVREREFGVWRYFRELGQRYRSFEFLHGHGLGVLAIGDIPAPLAAFFTADEAQIEYYRKLYAKLGASVGAQQKDLARPDSEIENRQRRVDAEPPAAPRRPFRSALSTHVGGSSCCGCLRLHGGIRRTRSKRQQLPPDARSENQCLIGARRPTKEAAFVVTASWWMRDSSQLRYGYAVYGKYVTPQSWQLLKLRVAAALRYPFDLQRQIALLPQSRVERHKSVQPLRRQLQNSTGLYFTE